ncbi:hypothetical protein K1T71_006161 [Dendrolimus kikuchii]|uniref:Uncharacterized protein n=1 Tax=Dendrolimus kikuchii TaxID=765133 RepID=A0ACC1D367_9NEOP|nr:hypothetical protein K1T71_006161 [Dendrolimus kikuchii]
MASNTTQTTMNKLVVLFSVVAVAVANPSIVAPLALTSVVPGSSSLSAYSTSIVHGSPYLGARSWVGAPIVGPAVVPAVATIAQAPHSPAVVLDAVNGVPLDTPEVVAARAAHYQARALSGLHHIGKRSVAPLAWSSSVVAPIAPVAPIVTSYSTPLVSGYSAPLVTLGARRVITPLGLPGALSIHPY